RAEHGGARPGLVRRARPRAPRLPGVGGGRARFALAARARRRPGAGRALAQRGALLPGVVRPAVRAGADERDARTLLGLRRRPAGPLAPGAGAARDALLRRRARDRCAHRLPGQARRPAARTAAWLAPGGARRAAARRDEAARDRRPPALDHPALDDADGAFL